jgi:hypothetical protein
MAINSIVVMVPKVGVQAKGANLKDGGDRDVQGVSYRLYTADNLASGSRFTLSLDGNPNANGQASLIGSGSLLTLEIGLVVFALVLGLASWWLIRAQRRGPKARPAPAEGNFEENRREPEEPDTLIDAIIALDDLYQAGNLPEPAYRVRRAELKARLADTIK